MSANTISANTISANTISANTMPLLETSPDLQRRIIAMHRRDTTVAWITVLGLWFAILYVATVTWPLAPMPAMRVVLLMAGSVVLILNTAAILAMLRHYREDRDFMYGLDIQFLDEARAARAARRGA